MALRAACALVVSWACCAGCSHTQSAQQPQGPPPGQSASQSLAAPLMPVFEDSKFVLESTNTFFSTR